MLLTRYGAYFFLSYILSNIEVNSLVAPNEFKSAGAKSFPFNTPQTELNHLAIPPTTGISPPPQTELNTSQIGPS